jgi:hypothetical protein
MRNILFASGVLLVAVSLAAAQTTVTPSWFASNRYEWAATAPLVNTPVIQLDNPTMQAGASNATAGNAAGASANTPLNLGISTSGSTMPYAWTTPMLLSAPQGAEPSTAGRSSAGNSAIDLGAAAFDSAYDFPNLGQQSIAQIAAETRKRAEQHATKTFTNDDVSRLKSQVNTPPPASQPSSPQP